MSQAVTNFKNTRENPTDAWKFYGEGSNYSAVLTNLYSLL